MAQILVIDDDPVLQQVIRLTLEAAGHTVLRCDNGRKAIDIVTYDHADLIVTDIIMPEMDGIEMVRAVRRVRPELPIVAISGGSNGNADDYLGMAKVFGASMTLTKPFRPQDLVTAIAELLENGSG
ncbi:MAG: response regulator [Alphaproteobacteria bacterium]|nr:response regulator [Alphaproteobacteria bacterium]